MKRFLQAFVLLFSMSAATALVAQDNTWVQIEAQPTEAEAMERAGSYAGRLPDVNGFRLSTGWYAIVLGPYSEDTARVRRDALLATGAIPGDSYLTDGPNFLSRFYGLDVLFAAPADPVVPADPVIIGEETPAEARRAERSLTRADRAEVQTALRAAGVYASVIDADFGPGTRRAMAAWQTANGFEATGILTSLQRRDLIEGFRTTRSTLGLEAISDPETGIAITLPLGLARFDRHEAPFARYVDDDGAPRVLLISQTGDRASLAALYNVMETLEIMPLDGPRSLGRAEFTLTGSDAVRSIHAFARLNDGAIKGYVLIWPAGDEARRQMALAEMQASFRPVEGVLPDDAGTSQQIDLLAGLRIRSPERAVSGFFVAPDGSLLTSASAVGDCGRLEIGEDTQVEVAATDDAKDLALLQPEPETELSPLAYARLSAAEPRLQSDIAVAGFSFGGVLTQPSVTFGTLADVRGLDGDEGVHRLALLTEPGDTGGPVFDATGAVTGMLLPEETGARVLPGDVAFARDSDGLSAFLAANGINPALGGDEAPMAPEDLAALAADMTVLVTCWN